jgi:hypothetical protein
VAGDLIVNEIRGPQDGGDSWGQWIEIANTGGAELDLEGAVLDVVSVSGNVHLTLIVRRSLPVPAGGFVTLGQVVDADRPAWIDYGLGDPEALADFPPSGAVALFGCSDDQLDRVVYDALPEMGTYSLDADGTWCTDATPGDDTTALGLPGTPGEMNHACAAP